VAGSAGGSLFTRAWLPENPERVVQVVHGFGEHSGRYECLAAWLSARGCAVHAYDHQGHGRSSGTRGHVRRFADLLDDLETRLDALRQQHPDLPIVLLGQSMGGLVVAAFAVERQPNVAGAILTSAALALPDDLSRLRRLAAKILRHVAPRVSMASGLDPNGLSRDPEVVRNYVDDPLVFGDLTLSLAAEMLSAIERTVGAGSQVSVPTLVIHGAADPICEVAGSERFARTLRAPGSQLRIYPELLHETLHEPEREAVFQEILDWILDREASAAPGPPAVATRKAVR
jgi:alpha-beta hydrolase superfamily lysophospholipase